MISRFSLAAILSILALAVGGQTPAAAEPKGKTCTMEQQCHWENFKKVCTWVKVCR